MQLVKELRDRTQAGLNDCKAALVEADGDLENAVVIIQKKGLAKSVKRAGAIASEGLVVTSVAADGKLGAIAEVNRMKSAMHVVGRELAEANQQQKALLDEINHRVKNTLGTVQSIARLSRASSGNLDEYAVAFEARLVVAGGAQ